MHLGDGKAQDPQEHRRQAEAERPKQVLVLVAHHRKVLTQEQEPRLARQNAAGKQHEGSFEEIGVPACVRGRVRGQVCTSWGGNGREGEVEKGIEWQRAGSRASMGYMLDVACCMLYVACCMLHVGRLKEFMEANSRKSGLLMLFMFLEMARFPIYFIVARLASVCAASFFLLMQSISCVHQHAQASGAPAD